MQRTRGQRQALAGGMLAVLACALALMGGGTGVSAAAQTTPSPRPPQAVAYARIAVVRVVTSYFGTINNSAPIPVLTSCSADGVLVGTTGDGLNSYNYVLLPTAVVNPLVPCQGVQAAFQQLNGTATGWGITRISVLLSAAYTGTGQTQLGSVSYTINPAAINTDGGPGGPPVLVLPLTGAQGAPQHDLPVLTVPQPSDAPATGRGTFLDLTDVNGSLTPHDALQPESTATTLYPISATASAAVGGAATPATAATGGATAAPTSAPGSKGVDPHALTLGAPEIDANGRLIGMVLADAQGNPSIASLDTLKGAIGSVTGKSGPLMNTWQQGLQAFYATPPQFAQAQQAFAGLAQTAPDFGGAVPFAKAAGAQSTTIPSLLAQPTPTPSTFAPAQTPVGTNSTRQLVAVLGATAIVVLLCVALGALLLLRARRRRAAMLAEPPIPEEERMLNLLPRDADLSLLDNTDVPTAPQPALLVAQQSRPTPAIADQPTAVLAAAHAPVSVRPPHARTQPRPGSVLVTNASGRTDPGKRRAGEPNQDNLLALHGIRRNGTRPQPYGLFIIADGMGGHLHGQEASSLTIEIVTRTVLQLLSTAQDLDEQALSGVLAEGVQRAHGELRRRNVDHASDMGTTLTAALVADDLAHVVNVGDSRTYLLNPDTGLRQITTDHSVVASLVAAGVIRPEDIYTHPRRNQIYRSLGGDDERIEIDTFRVPLQAGDKLVLCSDGLWEMVRDPQIAHIVRATADPERAAELLVREANTNGGEDNISVLVVRVVEEAPLSADPEMRVLVPPQSAQLPPVR